MLARFWPNADRRVTGNCACARLRCGTMITQRILCSRPRTSNDQNDCGGPAGGCSLELLLIQHRRSQPDARIPRDAAAAEPRLPTTQQGRRASADALPPCKPKFLPMTATPTHTNTHTHMRACSCTPSHPRIHAYCPNNRAITLSCTRAICYTTLLNPRPKMMFVPPPGLAQSSPKSAEFGANLVDPGFWSTVAEVRPMLADIGPDLAEIGPKLVYSGKRVLDFTELGKSKPIGRFRASKGQFQANVGRIRPHIGRTRPNLCPKSGHFCDTQIVTTQGSVKHGLPPPHALPADKPAGGAAKKRCRNRAGSPPGRSASPETTYPRALQPPSQPEKRWKPTSV